MSGVYFRAWIETGRRAELTLSLDGASGLLRPDDQSVIYCLSELVGDADVVVAEAVRSAYDVNYGRVGTLAGIPIVLGWENHERQWRGPTYAEIAGSRRDDMELLYSAVYFDTAETIIERYGINYILYGSTERQQYETVGEEKFLDNLPIVCESGQSRIFATGIING